MRILQLRALVILLIVLLFFISTASGDCECGYAVNATTASAHQVFTDLLETNFLTAQDIAYNTDWKVQKYYTEPNPTYGRNCTAENVISNPVVDNSTLDADGKRGGIPGLQLWVGGGVPVNKVMPSAEIKTMRTDMLYGSIRIAARLTPVNGTCSAMFTIYNDSQEIDIEMLSRQYTNYTRSDRSVPSSPINLVLHSIAALEAGFQIPNISPYGVPTLPTSLTDAFHEYRFDWTPGLVSFYFDGAWPWDLVDSNVPIMPSALLLSHWSNGAPGWSQGPPDEDAVITFSYVKAYFNSSDPQQQRDYAKRCSDLTASNSICVIPDQKGAPDRIKTDNNGTIIGTASTFFFNEQHNQTANQTVFTGVSLASQDFAVSNIWLALGLILIYSITVM